MSWRIDGHRLTAPLRWSRHAAIVALFLAALLPFVPFRVDDAYISYVYARNLAMGNGLTYNGTVVEGYSNLVWVLLLSPFLRTGWDPLVIARVASVAAGAGALLVVHRLCSLSVARPNGLSPFLATACVAVLAPFSAWTMGGLETVFLSLLVVLFVLSEWNAATTYPAVSPLLLLIIALTRPEGVLLFPIWLLFRSLRGMRWTRASALESASFLLLYSLFLAWRWGTYGYLLPNTAYLKLSPSLATTVEAGRWLLGFFALRPAFSLLLILGVFVTLTRATRLRPTAAFLLAILGGFFAFVLFSGKDWMPHHRFLAPVVPLMAPFLAVALDAFERITVRTALVVLAAIAIGFELVMANTLYRPLTVEFGRFTEGLVRAGHWVNDNTAPTATIAVVDAGAMAYYGNRPTIDILGLNDEHIAHSPARFDVRYVVAQQPDVIQLHVGFTVAGQLLPPTDGTHSQNFIDDPGFRECYGPDLGRPPDPYYPFLFLRTCSPRLPAEPWGSHEVAAPAWTSMRFAPRTPDGGK